MRRTIWPARRRSPTTVEHYPLPTRAVPGWARRCKSTVHPLRTDIPIMLGAEGPKNVALAAEIADGWLPIFYSPKRDGFYRAALAKGFARPGARHTPEDVRGRVHGPRCVINDDVEAAADMLRPSIALYIGGMGARGANFHYDAVARLGYEDECAAIQELYLAGRKDEAARAIPLAMVEKMALVGPADKIAEEIGVWQDSLITTMVVTAAPPTLRLMAELVG